MEAVLEELNLMETKNIQKITDKYGVERSTLSRRYYGKTTTKVEGYNSQRLLSPGATKALIKYINDLSERGLPPMYAMVRNLAYIMALRMPGINWILRWVKQNLKHLKSCYLLPINRNQKRANLALYYSLYFKLLGRKIK